MNITLPHFQKARILVVGDVMLDRYWHGDTLRISPEAPVPVVHVNQCEERPGGAANVALNIKVLGCQATLLSIIGTDTNADQLDKLLKAANIACSWVRTETIPTITKLRILSKHQQLLRLDFEEKLPASAIDQLMLKFEEILINYDALVLSDYGKGALTHSKTLIAAAKQKNIPVFIDPKNSDFDHYRGATMITPNLKEFEAAAGKWQSEAELIQKAHALIKQHDLGSLLITRSEHGMTLVKHDQPPFHLPTHAKEIYDVTGAGDTVIATIAAAIASGSSFENAVKLANIAAGISISKLGAASVSLPELRRAIQGFHEGGIVTEEQLLSAVMDAKALGEKIVMTNGCFDILHAGHVAYLKEAKKLGDRLIVAVNDDASVKRLKGEGRPINTLEKRMAVLEGLDSVDWVVPFSEDTPERLITAILPDVLAKGGDYTPDQIAGASAVIKNGGKIKILSFLDGHSTTSVLTRIQKIWKEMTS